MQSTEQDIKKYVRLILKKKRLFFAAAASIMTVFVMAGYILPKTYEATCTVLIEKSVYDEYVKGIAITQDGGPSLGGLSFAIKSKNLVLKVLRDLGRVTDTTGAEEQESMVKGFQDRTTMTIPPNPNKSTPKTIDLFQMSYRDTDPELARDFVNMLVRRFKEEEFSGKKEDTSEARRLLSEQVKLFKNKIDTIESAISALNTGANVYTVADEGKQNEKLLPLQNRLDELSAKYTDDYPEVIAVKAEINHLQNQLKSLGARGAVKNGRSTAQHGYGNDSEGPGKKRLDLERERDTYKKIYEELVLRLSQSEVSQQMGPMDRTKMFNISEPAVLPTKPVSPDRVKIIVMGIFAGLAGGIGLIMLLDALDHSVKSSAAVRGLGLPVLAIIPKIQNEESLRREQIQDGIVYGIAGLYMLCILAIVAIEAMRPS